MKPAFSTPLLLLVAELAAVARCQPSWQQAFEPEKQYMLKQRDAITNWKAFASGNGVTGWSENSSVAFCQWTGISCSPTPLPSGEYTYFLTLACDSFPTNTDRQLCSPKAQGTLAPELAQCTSLRSLEVTNQSLAGQLPEQWGSNGSLPLLEQINLSNNALTGAIPASWGSDGSLPSLEGLDLQGNKGLCGPVPAALQGMICGPGNCTDGELPACPTAPDCGAAIGSPPWSAAAPPPPPPSSSRPSAVLGMAAQALLAGLGECPAGCKRGAIPMRAACAKSMFWVV
ncbi:hypothetical protein ABPG77_004560 [Micractinium sp. CCAP 211/92]